jgi:hypothetical protein
LRLGAAEAILLEMFDPARCVHNKADLLCTTK